MSEQSESDISETEIEQKLALLREARKQIEFEQKQEL
jgi:hypothetical protein